MMNKADSQTPPHPTELFFKSRHFDKYYLLTNLYTLLYKKFMQNNIMLGVKQDSVYGHPV